MTPETAVTKIVSLLKGGDLNLGDYTLRLPGGGGMNLAVGEESDDIKIVFTGKKPVASYFAFNLEISGLVICIKGIKVDVTSLPKRVDPFIPWEDLSKL